MYYADAKQGHGRFRWAIIRCSYYIQSSCRPVLGFTVDLIARGSTVGCAIQCDDLCRCVFSCYHHNGLGISRWQIGMHTSIHDEQILCNSLSVEVVERQVRSYTCAIHLAIGVYHAATILCPIICAHDRRADHMLSWDECGS